MTSTNITFYLNKRENAPIGQIKMLRNFILFHQGVNSLIADVNCGTTYKNCLCFFRCLSLFCGFSLIDLENDTQTKFCLYCNHRKIDFFTFQGVFLNDLIILEDLFQNNVKVYELVERENETVCRLNQNTRKIYSETMKLNLFKNHFSYIFNFEKYSSIYHCSKCDVLWYQPIIYNQHLRSNTDIKKVFLLTPTLFEELAELGMYAPENDRFYLYFSVFDFECVLSKENLLSNTLLLQYEAFHNLLSCSVASSVPDFGTLFFLSLKAIT